MDSSAAETAASVRRLVEQHMAVFDAHDTDGYTSLYAGDAVVHDPLYPEPMRGREAIRKDIEEFFTAFPDIISELRQVLADEGSAAVEITLTAVNSGPVAMPDGTSLPATGKQVHMPVAFFDRFDDAGRIVEERRYYDVAGLFGQLGMGR